MNAALDTRPATDNQTRYVLNLLGERDWRTLWRERATFVARAEAILANKGTDLTFDGASSLIEMLKPMPIAAHAQSNVTVAQVIEAATVVPAGRYALEVDGVVKFYKIDRPTDGRWAGRVFVKVMASDEEWPVRGKAGIDVLDAIAADVLGASTRYGREIGKCGVCHRTLTDEASRAAGIGPRCAGKM